MSTGREVIEYREKLAFNVVLTIMTDIFENYLTPEEKGYVNFAEGYRGFRFLFTPGGAGSSYHIIVRAGFPNIIIHYQILHYYGQIIIDPVKGLSEKDKDEVKNMMSDFCKAARSQIALTKMVDEEVRKYQWKS